MKTLERELRHSNAERWNDKKSDKENVMPVKIEVKENSYFKIENVIFNINDVIPRCTQACRTEFEITEIKANIFILSWYTRDNKNYSKSLEYSALKLLINNDEAENFIKNKNNKLDDIRTFVQVVTGMTSGRHQLYAVVQEYYLKRNHLDALTDITNKKDIIDSLGEKDREIYTTARIGQGKFRKELLKYWGKCSVTECEKLDVLIASHIKPWRECNVQDAIDGMNGLLLIPNLDALFDKGFISFDDDRKIIISSQLSKDDQERLGVNKDMVLRKKPNERHKIYLEYHRENIFQE